MQTPLASALQGSFNIVSGFLYVSLPNNVDAQDVSELEERILNSLNQDKRIGGVIFDFTAVFSTDPIDLERLQNCLLAVRLMGRRVAICGINPGVAAVIIRSGLELHHDLAGYDIDDVLMRRER